MPDVRAVPVPDRSVGSLLQHWRKTRRLSQLALATQAEISSRHLCFIETGRANPSRDMVLLLASVLDVPLRERNGLLLAAGFAPVYLESTLDAPALAAVRGALDAILRQQEPFPAVVMNRTWDILQTNEAAARFFGFLLDDAAPARPPTPPANVLRMMFHPDALRPFVANWDDVATALIARVHREAVGGVPDQATRQLLAEILDYPGVPASLRTANLGMPLVPVVPVSFRKDDLRFNFFSTVTTLGTPQDITVQEIRLECFFPADEATERAARDLASPSHGRRRASRPDRERA
jgi:transcriptional regulator with XRE-family HTH domain